MAFLVCKVFLSILVLLVRLSRPVFHTSWNRKTSLSGCLFRKEIVVSLGRPVIIIGLEVRPRFGFASVYS